MKKITMILSVVAAGCLLSGGLTFASSERTELTAQNPVFSPPVTTVREQAVTNVLLRQILAEVIKANAVRSDNRCSDGEKRYSPGYIISTDKNTLRCSIGNGYPEWVEGGKS